MKNLCDACGSCENREGSYVKCLNECGAPLDAIKAYEHQRNKAEVDRLRKKSEEPKTVTRLDVLKREKEQISNMRCLAFDVKEAAVKYYDHEIECITKWNSPNPVYEEV